MGHDHAKVRPWDHSGHGAYLSSIGAAFYGIRHPNSFQLIRVAREQEVYESKYFEWDPSVPMWQEVTRLKNRWPFESAISRLALPSVVSDKPVGVQAKELFDELWKLIKGRDYSTGLSRWLGSKDWFEMHKDEIDAELVEEIMLCIEEIKSMSE